MSLFKDPITPQEWQDAVDAAEAYLGLESAKMFGLVRGGPVVNTHRCEQIIRLGKARGVVPIRENVELCIKSMATGGQS